MGGYANLAGMMVIGAAASFILGAATCGTAAEIISDAKVYEWRAPPVQQPRDVGITFDFPGLSLGRTSVVEWERCDVALSPYIVGGGAILPSGERIYLAAGRLRVSQASFAKGPEPAHPRLKDLEFSSSDSVLIGTLRAGIWHTKDGKSEVWVFDPTKRQTPRRMFTSSLHLVGLSYLPRPDTAGGGFTLWQKVTANQFRVVGIAWTEEGIR